MHSHVLCLLGLPVASEICKMQTVSWGSTTFRQRFDKLVETASPHRVPIKKQDYNHLRTHQRNSLWQPTSLQGKKEVWCFTFRLFGF